MRSQSSVRAWSARRNAPAAPIAADSVAVVMPKRITASTTIVRMPSGITDDDQQLQELELLRLHLPVVPEQQQRRSAATIQK